MDIKGVAVKIARQAGLFLKENIGRAGKVEFKGAVNIVTEADKKSEALIISELQKNFPGHGILTEESAEIRSASEYKWIIDPLDGTTNYAHGFPFFCVSIGFEASGRMVFGVVYDPVLDELFTAGEGMGAELNGKPIKVSGVSSLDRSLLATGFPYDLRTSRENNLDHFSNFTLRAQAIRRAGSAALDLCYVASGRFDGYWEMRLRPWDVAAASLIVKEAGGEITDFSGSPFSIYGNECLASNGLIHGEMLGVLRKKGPAAGKASKA
ncbi:MAG: inositol monophosphatase [Deltaproteobacteria bacterium]|nr:inositol monophosphatase [Deltaproteobacteria bacterium]